jgi:hypothetical protein
MLLFVGNKVEKLCDLCNITLNKNAVFGDSSALSPGGVRIGENHCVCFKVLITSVDATSLKPLLLPPPYIGVFL